MARAKELLKSLQGMSSVEELIERQLQSEARQLTEVCHYLLELGGKRIRPALCLLVARALGNSAPLTQLTQVAAGIELIHMATLLHDDIIDKSPLRRNSESAFLRYGLTSTLLAGDFLLVRAFGLCAQLDHSIVQETERACVELTEGEILELPLFDKRATLDDSLLIAKKKTAALFRLACFSAAKLSQQSPEICELYASFGESLGIAFQILDDVLDVAADEDLLGKPRGTDIREAKPSVVNVLWLTSKSPLAATVLTRPRDTVEMDADLAEQCLAELESKDCNVLDEARQLALSYVEVARAALKQVEVRHPVADHSELHVLSDFVVERLH